MTQSFFDRFERAARPPRQGPILRTADIGLILALFVGSRLALLATAWLASTGAFGFEPFAAGDPFKTIVRWDAQWYLEIAFQGYHSEAGVWDTGDGTNWAFFPLLPMLIRGVHLATGFDRVASGLIVAHLAFLAGLFLFFAYARELYGRAFARFAVVLFAVWPFTIHQSVPMSECLFVPLSIAVLWLGRRGQFLWTAVAAAFLSATRTVGPFMAFPLLAIAARRFGLWRILTLQPGTERAVTALASCGLGIGLFILYMQATVGDGLGFTHAQVAWNRSFQWPWMTVLDELNPLILPFEWWAYNAFNIAVAVVALVLAFKLYRMRLGPEAGFVALSVFLGLAAGQTTSLPRFMGAMAPLVLVVARMSMRHRVRPWVTGLFVGLMLAAGYAWCIELLYVM